MTDRRYYDRALSTHRLAVDEARARGPTPLVFVAGAQSHGVGRLDHTWSSPHGGLYLSAIAPAPSAGLALLPLAVGACLATSLGRRYALDVGIRWPNDLVVPRRGDSPKLAGTLVDRVASERGPAVVVSVGLNVAAERWRFPEELRGRVVSLADLSDEVVAPDELEPLVLAAIVEALGKAETAEGSRAIVAECRTRLVGIGEHVLVDGVPCGTVLGVADDGALEVDDGGELRAILTGTVTYEPEIARQGN